MVSRGVRKTGVVRGVEVGLVVEIGVEGETGVGRGTE